MGVLFPTVLALMSIAALRLANGVDRTEPSTHYAGECSSSLADHNSQPPSIAGHQLPGPSEYSSSSSLLSEHQQQHALQATTSIPPLIPNYSSSSALAGWNVLGSGSNNYGASSSIPPDSLQSTLVADSTHFSQSSSLLADGNRQPPSIELTGQSASSSRSSLLPAYSETGHSEHQQQHPLQQTTTIQPGTSNSNVYKSTSSLSNWDGSQSSSLPPPSSQSTHSQHSLQTTLPSQPVASNPNYYYPKHPSHAWTGLAANPPTGTNQQSSYSGAGATTGFTQPYISRHGQSSSWPVNYMPQWIAPKPLSASSSSSLLPTPSGTTPQSIQNHNKRPANPQWTTSDSYGLPALENKKLKNSDEDTQIVPIFINAMPPVTQSINTGSHFASGSSSTGLTLPSSEEAISDYDSKGDISFTDPAYCPVSNPGSKAGNVQYDDLEQSNSPPNQQAPKLGVHLALGSVVKTLDALKSITCDKDNGPLTSSNYQSFDRTNAPTHTAANNDGPSSYQSVDRTNVPTHTPYHKSSKHTSPEWEAVAALGQRTVGFSNDNTFFKTYHDTPSSLDSLQKLLTTPGQFDDSRGSEPIFGVSRSTELLKELFNDNEIDSIKVMLDLLKGIVIRTSKPISHMIHVVLYSWSTNLDKKVNDERVKWEMEFLVPIFIDAMPYVVKTESGPIANQMMRKSIFMSTYLARCQESTVILSTAPMVLKFAEAVDERVGVLTDTIAWSPKQGVDARTIYREIYREVIANKHVKKELYTKCIVFKWLSYDKGYDQKLKASISNSQTPLPE